MKFEPRLNISAWGDENYPPTHAVGAECDEPLSLVFRGTKAEIEAALTAIEAECAGARYEMKGLAE